MSALRLPFRPRTARLIEIQAALGDAVRAADTRADASPHPLGITRQPPSGMRWLVTPREAMQARGGDATTARIAFARYQFSRTFLGPARMPTTASLRECARRLRALALYRYALRQHAAGQPLPLKAGRDEREVPAWAVRPVGVRPVGVREKMPRPARRMQQSDTTRLSQDDIDQLLRLLDFWDAWGDVSPDEAAALFDTTTIFEPDDTSVAGGAIAFDEVLGMLADVGFSDLQIAGMLDGAWSGQASLWAGADALSEAGVAGIFNLDNPHFFDYLRNQSGYLIRGITDTTRRDIAESLWGLLGANAGPGVSWEAIADHLGTHFGPELAGLMGYSADWRAYAIAVTEIARAESFGNMVALYQLGARRKIWIVNAGACQICIGNAEAGDIPLDTSFPSGVQAPPAHPICRCAVSAATSSDFNPDDWVARDPGPLFDLLGSVDGAVWPDVDLGGFLDASDFELAARPTVTRATPKVLPDASAAAWYATGQRLAAIASEEALRWASAAHIGGVPEDDAALKALARRLRKGHDEVPDAREADELYVHRLRERFADALRTTAKG